MNCEIQTGRKTGVIRRAFCDLSEEQVNDAERSLLLRHSLFGKSQHWDDILESRLILLLSEAQSGKSYECRTRHEKLWNDGEPAFLIELASVASQPWRDLRSPEESARLEAWRRGTVVATIFLDSVDELKLTQGSFRTALRNVANDLAGQMNRVRVILTSRPLPVDRELFIKTFAAPRPSEQFTENDFANLAMGKTKTDKQKGAAPEIRNVALLPLDRADIATVAAGRGVDDTDAFLEALTNASMIDFMKRPQDVIEAASAWLELDGRFGTHAQQVNFDIKARLKPNPERDDRMIANDRALDGARRLALGVVLTRRLTIRHDVNHDTADLDAALDPTVLLSEWDDGDRKALLERALFGFASYGRVRFHNRLAFEFLAAQRLADLIDQGLSRKAVRRLLVVEIAQGVDVIRPSLHEVAAWLALRHDWLYELVTLLDPALLMNLGDPGSLSVEQRGKVLLAYIERYGRGGWRGLSVPQIQIHRLANRSLASIVNREYASIENPEVRQVLLDLINQARLDECAAIARSAVRDPAIHIYERMDALDALIALDDSELSAIAEDLRAAPGPWDPQFSRAAIYRLFPKWMTVDQLLAILEWVGETKSTGSELSRNLPPLIDTLDVADLEDLRVGLTPLIEQGLRLDEVQYAMMNDRPHLVHLLTAVLARLIEANALPLAAARSVVIAAELARTMRSDDGIPALLQGAIATTGSELRDAIFKAEVALMRELRSERPRLDHLMDLIWRGALRFLPTDETWMRIALADPDASRDLRAAALQAEMFALVPDGDKHQSHLEALRPLVADDAELAKALEDRLAPHVRSRQERRWEIKRKWHERQANRREAKGFASWVMFWRELKDDPETAFSPARAHSTAWNLYKAMGRGANRPESGWNRALIQDHLGTEVANRLRHALMPIWRRQRLPLASERPEAERNSLFETWILALTAIAAEAENLAWAEALDAEEVETAIRYAPWYSGGFPPWLDTLAARYPDMVDLLLGGELSWEMAQPATAQSYSITLQNISHAAPPLARLFLPRLRAWLETSGGHSGKHDDLEVAARRLQQVADVLLKFGDDADRNWLGEAAAAALTRGTNEAFAHVFLPVLFEVDSERAVTHFEAICGAIPVSRHSAAVNWFANLFGRHHRGRGFNLKHARMTPNLLIRLLRLAYRHVELAEDEVHEGSYSPETRDDAETARNALLNAIIDLGGPEGWQTKHRIAREPEFSHLRDRLHSLAMEKSAAESDDLAMPANEVVKLDRLDEPGPRSAAEIFALMTDRIEDLRDHLLSDVSPREMWAAVDDERVLRRAIAAWLISEARGAYTIGQEGVTADEKETDIRFRSTVNGVEGVIELKVGDKAYSGADLAATISDQLVGKYLAPAGRRAGLLLVTRAKRDSWRHADDGATLDFAGLIAMLGDTARKYRDGFPGEIHLNAVGLDLVPRLPTERDAKARRSSAGGNM